MRPVSSADHRGAALAALVAEVCLMLVSLPACSGATGREIAAYVDDAGVDEGESIDSELDASTAPVNLDAATSRRRPPDGAPAADSEPTSRKEGGSLIRSGTRSCETDRECFGLSCAIGPTPKHGVCVTPCTVDEDCDVNERCVGGVSFARSCFAACTLPTQCALGFDCFDYLGNIEYSCLPTSWLLDPDGGQ
jgi:hypothetical protein